MLALNNHYQKNYIDRIFDTDQHHPIHLIGTNFKSTISKVSNHDFFTKSLIIKDVAKTLDLVFMKKTVYQQLKLLCLTSTVVIAIFMIIAFNIFSSLISQSLLLLFFAAIGFSLPDIYLVDRLQERKFKLFLELPDFFELLSLYMSSASYDSFSTAFRNVSQSMTGLLAKEFQVLSQKSHYLTNDQLMEELSVRIDDSLIQDLVVTVKLSHQFGGNISDKIELLAQEAKKSRLLRAKEIGTRAAGLLLIPLILFHLPVVLVIFLLPSIVAI